VGRPRPKELMGLKISELDKDIKLQCNRYKRKGIARHVRWTKQGVHSIRGAEVTHTLKDGIGSKRPKICKIKEEQ